MSLYGHPTDTFAGLGIDLGRHPSSSRPQSTNLRRHSRRFTSAAIDRRRVRIASGNPDILGYGVGCVAGEYLMSPDESGPDQEDDRYSSSSAGSRTHPRSHPHGRRRSLSIAVVPMSSDSDWQASSSAEDPDTPDTELSAASYTSARSHENEAIPLRSAMKSSSTLRKQASQPTMHLTRVTTTGANPDQRLNGGFARRTQSSIALYASYMSDDADGQLSTSSSSTELHQSGTSLGRTAAIPRRGSRSAEVTRRVRTRTQTWDAASLPSISDNITDPTADADDVTIAPTRIPDGFGGWVERDQAADQVRSLSTLISPSKSAAVNDDDLATINGPALTDPTGNAGSSASTACVKAASNHPLRHRSHSVVGCAPFDAAIASRAVGSEPRTLRVGSFYDRDGQETAQLLTDEDTRYHASILSSASIYSSDEGFRSQKDASRLHKSVSMCIIRCPDGLEGAERGEAMVALDPFSRAFSKGDTIAPLTIARYGTSEPVPPAIVTPLRTRILHQRAQSLNNVGHRASQQETTGPTLARQSTLLSTAGDQARRSRDLNRLLGNGGRKLNTSTASEGNSIQGASTNTTVPQRRNPMFDSGEAEAAAASAVVPALSRINTFDAITMPTAVLEQSKSVKARVEIDVVLESDLIVEGGMLRGHLEVKVRKPPGKDGRAVMVSQPKVRVVGFEDLESDDTRHIFYHHATVIDGDRWSLSPSQPYVLHGSPDVYSPNVGTQPRLPCFDSPPDTEGYSTARVGSHLLPFSLELPIGKGAKGSYRGKHASVCQTKSSDNTDRSIAHFYRHIELYPYLNPAVVLSSAPRPMQATASKGLLFGGSGKVHLTASLHRATWVAGQRVHIKVEVDNETSKKIKSMSLSLIRTVTLYRPRPELIAGLGKGNGGGYDDPDACSTTTSRKRISEQTLEMGQKGSKGGVTAKGWWTGVESGRKVESSHFMCLPTDALSISRGRHVEVVYSIKVAVGSSLSADVSVELPLRVVNFVSLDPPPMSHRGLRGSSPNHAATKSPGKVDEDPLVARLRSMDGTRSPNEPRIIRASPGDLSRYPPGLAVPGIVAQGAVAPSTSTSGAATSIRNLQHQKSLDFINSAIRSARARREPQASSAPLPLGLGIEVSDCEDEVSSDVGSSSDDGATPKVDSGILATGLTTRAMQLALQMQMQQQSRGKMPLGVPALGNQGQGFTYDDYDDEVEEADGAGDRTLGLNDDSLDEVDVVVGSATLERPAVFPSRSDLVDEEGDSFNSKLSDNVEEAHPPALARMEEDLEVDDVSASFESMSTLRGGQEHEAMAVETDDAERKIVHQAPSHHLQHRPLLLVQRREDAQAALSSKTTAKGDPAGKGKVVGSSSRPAEVAPAVPSATPSRMVATPGSTPSGTLSPSRAASPVKPALKKQSSFGYASAASPLKTKASSSSLGKSSSSKLPAAGPNGHMSTGTLRAKVDMAGVEKIGSSPAQGSCPTSSPSAALRVGAKLEARSPEAAIAVGEKAVREIRRSGNPKPKRKRGHRADRHGASVGSIVSGSESTNSDCGPASSLASESISSECEASRAPISSTSESAGLPARTVPSARAADAQLTSTPTTSVPSRVNTFSEDSAPPSTQAKATSLVERPVISTVRQNVSSTSTSTLSKKDMLAGLHRTTSTHNLRGAAVVLPSVRNKIAMLENRTSALRTFTSGASMAPRGISSPLSTPTKLSSSSSVPAGTMSGSLASPASRRPLGGMSGSASMGVALGRKLSVVSNASEAPSEAGSVSSRSSIPAYMLRRADSVASFKAPVLRDTK